MTSRYTIDGKPVVFPEWCTSEESKQGFWGEVYVKRQYEKAGFLVIHSAELDQFAAWDLIVIHIRTGRTKMIQVKTITRYVTQERFGLTLGKKGFTLASIKECNELILVVRNVDPKYGIDDIDYKGKVLLVLDHGNYNVYNDQYIIPSNPANFVVMGQLTEDELEQVSSFQTSK
jgi:hypothetical protein